MDINYNEVIDFILEIGYKHRIASYYVIREKDGYINISNDELRFSRFDKNITTYISFHKNFYQGYSNKDISKKFYDIETFYKFISEYHNKLFMKHKIKKIKRIINERK